MVLEDFDEDFSDFQLRKGNRISKREKPVKPMKKETVEENDKQENPNRKFIHNQIRQGRQTGKTIKEDGFKGFGKF